MISETAVSRRELLKRLSMAGAAALALPEFDRVLAFQREVLKATPAGVLSAPDAATLAAICARIIPTDESGPGAAEARAAEYIDRALGGWLAPSRDAYTAGLAAIDDAARARAGRRFVELERGRAGRRAWHARPDAVLRARACAHDTRHVLRSGIRRQREFRWLGSDWLSGRPPQRDGRRSTDGRAGKADSSIGLRLRDVRGRRALACSLPSALCLSALSAKRHHAH